MQEEIVKRVSPECEISAKGRKMLSGFSALVVAATAVLGQAEAPESNYEHLKEFGEAILGTWVGEFEIDVSLPDVVESGDRVTIESSVKWILNQTVLENDWKAAVNGKPAGEGKELIGWDRSTKQIKSFGFGTFGGCGGSIYHKNGSKWIELNIGATIDGKPIGGQSIYTLSEDGNTREIESIGRISPEGDVLPNLKVTYKRIKFMQ